MFKLTIPRGGYSVKKEFIGRWKIVDTSEWSEDFLDLEKEAGIKISSRGTGHINFGAFSGEIDAMKDEWNPDELMQFSFVGYDEGDPVSGRGSAKIVDGDMVGLIVFHCGMKSTFRAIKATVANK